VGTPERDGPEKSIFCGIFEKSTIYSSFVLDMTGIWD
jgi:hypothetical protein